MYDLIRRITAWLARLILGPCTGRHRAGASPGRPAIAAAPAHRPGTLRPRLTVHLPALRSPYGLDHALDGGAS
ncbi:hypothetical protein ABT115_30635, partial [Streptomyces sp. NPDC001832]